MGLGLDVALEMTHGLLSFIKAMIGKANEILEPIEA